MAPPPPTRRGPQARRGAHGHPDARRRRALGDRGHPAQPNPPEVVVLTTFEADELVLGALRAGAAGFLLKDTPPREILTAVQHVAAGEAQLSPSVLKRLIASAVATNPGSSRARGRIERLTERELEVARAIAEGLSNAEIGARRTSASPR